MGIEQLVKVVPPPAAPVDAGPITKRSEIEKSLGVTLPDDFFEIALRYGTGRFGGEIALLNPFAIDYFKHFEMITSCYRDLKQAEGNEYIPYEIFPNSPGFLPWGDDDNGQFFGWLTEGEPNRWPVMLIVGRQADVFQTLEMQMTTFLAMTFSEPLKCVLWDDEWQKDNLIGGAFVPSR